MKNRLLTFAGCLAVLLVVAKIYEKPLLAQIRAALVQNVDEPGRNTFVLAAPFGSTYASWAVPAGKRYVIEQFTLFCNQKNSYPVTNAVLQAMSGGVVYNSYAPAHYGQAISPIYTQYTVTGTGPVYADGGTSFSVFPELSSIDATDSPNCGFSVSGHVISNP